MPNETLGAAQGEGTLVAPAPENLVVHSLVGHFESAPQILGAPEESIVTALVYPTLRAYHLRGRVGPRRHPMEAKSFAMCKAQSACRRQARGDYAKRRLSACLDWPSAS
eukprot:scaffold68950_cov31-Tisochrysis_lutea.AAC.2